MGGVYVLGDNSGMRIERNDRPASPYHVYGWGGTSTKARASSSPRTICAPYARRWPPPLWAQQLVERNVFACRRRRRRPRLFDRRAPRPARPRNVVLRCDPRAAAAAMTSAAVGADGSGYRCRPTRRGWWWKGEHDAAERQLRLKRVLLDAGTGGGGGGGAAGYTSEVRRRHAAVVRGAGRAQCGRTPVSDVGRRDFRVGASGAAATVATISAPPTGRWRGGRRWRRRRLRRAAGAWRARAGARAARGGTAAAGRRPLAAVADAAGGAEMLATHEAAAASAQRLRTCSASRRADGRRAAAAGCATPPKGRRTARGTADGCAEYLTLEPLPAPAKCSPNGAGCAGVTARRAPILPDARLRRGAALAARRREGVAPPAVRC